MTFIMGAIEAWMSSNRLRLNSAKTQFIWLGNRQQLARLDMAALSAAFPLLTFSSAVRDLGVTLDSELTFSTQINLLSRDCLYQLRQLRIVTRSLTVLLHLQLPPLSSLQTFLTTAPRSMLASLPVDWGVWIGSCVLLPA